MRIAMVSTYPPIECGIATYSENLCKTYKEMKKEVLVLSQHGAKGSKVFPVYNADDDNIASEIFNVIGKLTPDVVHIQHEFGLYGIQHGIQVNELILRLRLSGLPIVTTLHTVNSPISMEHSIILGNIVRESDRVIVHEKYQKKILDKEFGDTGKIRVLPHGVRSIKPIKGAKETLGLNGKKVVLLCGYFRPTKRFDLVVKLWPEIAKKNKDAVLLIAGKMRGIEYSGYQKKFFEMINSSPVKKQIMTLRGQFPQHTFDTIISAGDIMVMPYEAGAQSGILSNAAAFGLPVVTSNLKSFADWNKKSGGGLTSNKQTDYIKNIHTLLNDDSLRKKLKDSLLRYIKPLLWENVAAQHLCVYEEIIRVPYGEAKYFYIPDNKIENY